MMGSALERGSCYFEELSGEVGEYFGAARREVDIVFDANPSPARTVDSRLDRHHRALTEQGLDGFRQPRRLVHLESQSVTEAVSESVTIASILNVATSQTVGILSLHSRPYRFRGDGVGVPHNVVDLALLARGGSDHQGARDVGAVALVLSAEIEEEQITALDHARRCARVRKRRPRARCDDRREGKFLASFVAQRVLEDSSDVQLGQSGPDSLDGPRQRADRDLSSVPDERDFVRILRLAQRLHHVDLGPPLPARALGEQALKVPMQQVGGLESNYLDPGEACCQIP